MGANINSHNTHCFSYVILFRTIATPGSLKDKTEEAWLPRHYVTASLVAGAVIITSIAAYKLLKQHPTIIGTGAQSMATAAAKKRDYL